MREHSVAFLKSILAGAAISLGGIIYLSIAGENRIVGAFLFSVGLVTVLLLGFNLYTGKVGYLIGCDKGYALDTLLTIPGNLIGCLILGWMKAPIGTVESLCAAKLEKAPLNVLVDGILCGVLIFICVEIYKKHQKLIGVLLCIPTFILCGFEHSVADMFYFANARLFSAQVVGFLLLVVIGNAIGGLAIPAVQWLCGKLSGAKKA